MNRFPSLKCARKDCGHDAAFMPFISFASVQKPDGPRATAELPLPVCVEHKSFEPADYVTDEAWAQIVATLRRAGKAYPSRETLRVSFIPIA